jgi:hypothetical protein
MPTADLLEFHKAAAGLAHDMLGDLKARHGEDHIRLFWPDPGSFHPDLDAAAQFGPETGDLVAAAAALIMQAYLAATELELRKHPN